MPRTTIEFRGEERNVVYEIGGAEPDVGIMGPYVSDWYFEDDHPADLTKEEQTAIEEHLDGLDLIVEEDHDDYDRA
jgi:hypothetical protein